MRAECLRYVRRIRNPKKREYAEAYLAFCLGQGEEEPEHIPGLGEMAHQAVRMEIDDILSRSAAKIREEYKRVVARPGRFEGQEPYVPYFYDLYLDGNGEEDEDEVVWVAVGPEDVLIFPELARRPSVALLERSDGFVLEVHKSQTSAQ